MRSTVVSIIVSGIAALILLDIAAMIVAYFRDKEQEYDEKMAAGLVPYRLPFLYRLCGWVVDDGTFPNIPGTHPNRESFLDPRVGRRISIIKFESLYWPPAPSIF